MAKAKRTVKKSKPRATRPAADSIKALSAPKRSRRFGLSININFGPAGQSCHWHCVYCPWAKPRGKSDKRSSAKQAPVPLNELMRDLRICLKKNPNLETVVLGGNSEPTLYPAFAELTTQIAELRTELKGKWSVVMLSNGHGLDRKEVVRACDTLDEVWIKVDCADDSLFKKTNKPLPKNGIDSHLSGIRKLRSPRIQTTLWKYAGKAPFQNWSAENLNGLLELYRDLKPAHLHLLTIPRKRPASGLQPVTYDEMEAFALRVAELGVAVEVFS